MIRKPEAGCNAASGMAFYAAKLPGFLFIDS